MGQKESFLSDRYPGQHQKHVQFVRRVLNIEGDIYDGEISDVLGAFRHANKSDTGILTYDEFKNTVPGIVNVRGVFMKTLFAFFSSTGLNHDMGLNFCEFLLLFFFFVTMNEQGLIEYVYCLLTNPEYNPYLHDDGDLSHVDTISKNIFYLLDIHWIGSGGEVRGFKSVDAKYTNESHHISHAKFQDACKHNHALMYPILALQVDLFDYVFHKVWYHHKGPGNELVQHLVTLRNKLHDVLGATTRVSVTQSAKWTGAVPSAAEHVRGPVGRVRFERPAASSGEPRPQSEKEAAELPIHIFSAVSTPHHHYHDDRPVPHQHAPEKRSLRSHNSYAYEPYHGPRSSFSVGADSAHRNEHKSEGQQHTEYNRPDGPTAGGYEHAVQKMKNSANMDSYREEWSRLSTKK